MKVLFAILLLIAISMSCATEKPVAEPQNHNLNVRVAFRKGGDIVDKSQIKSIQVKR